MRRTRTFSLEDFASDRGGGRGDGSASERGWFDKILQFQN